MDMEQEQLIKYEQNLAACYETEYMLSLKTEQEDQNFMGYSYDDVSEVSTAYTVANPPAQQVRDTPSYDPNDMEVQWSWNYVQFDPHKTDKIRSHVHTGEVIDEVDFDSSDWTMNDSETHGSTELVHLDGPNRKRQCVRQSEA